MFIVGREREARVQHSPSARQYPPPVSHPVKAHSKTQNPRELAGVSSEFQSEREATGDSATPEAIFVSAAVPTGSSPPASL